MAEIPWTWLAIRASGVTAWGLLTAVVIWGILLRTRILSRLTTGARLLDMRVSGIFDIANPDGVLEAIESTLPLRSTHVTRYLVVLRPA